MDKLIGEDEAWESYRRAEFIVEGQDYGPGDVEDAFRFAYRLHSNKDTEQASVSPALGSERPATTTLSEAPNANKHSGERVPNAGIPEEQHECNKMLLSSQNPLPPELQEFKEEVLDRMEPGVWEVTGTVDISSKTPSTEGE